MTEIPENMSEAGQWLKRWRESVPGLSQVELANRARGLATEAGERMALTPQSIQIFESGSAKRQPAWLKYAIQAIKQYASESGRANLDAPLDDDDSVKINLLPTFAGMGGGGTGDGDSAVVSFSRRLIETELRVAPDFLLAVIAEGNSMEPLLFGGDHILVDTRRVSISQPGLFCVWDGDAHVIKLVERVPNSDPPKIRLIPANALYGTFERLVDEIRIIGRVIWLGRKIQ
jgi:phage repressor protein C with HTH and peptisase S24 domain